jgi:moderate conductance mechanosensitive channel
MVWRVLSAISLIGVGLGPAVALAPAYGQIPEGATAPPASQSPTTTPDRNAFADMVRGMRDATATLDAELDAVAGSLGTVPEAADRVLMLMTDLEGVPALGRGALMFAIMIAIASVVEFAVRRLLRLASRRLTLAPGEDGSPSLGSGALQLGVDALGLALFTFVALLMSHVLLDRYHPMRELLTTGVLLILLVRGLDAITGFTLFLDLDEPGVTRDWRRLQRWMVLIGGIAGFGAFSSGLLQLYGVTPPLHTLYGLALGALVVALLVIAIWRLRGFVASKVIGPGEESEAGDRPPGPFAQTWHLVATVYVGALWIVWSINLLLNRGASARAAVLSVALLLAVPIAERLIHAALAAIAHIRPTRRIDSATSQWFMFGRIERVALRLVRIGLGIAALLCAGEAIGLGVIAGLETPIGVRVAGAFIDSAVAIILGWLAWEAAKAYIDRKIAIESEDQGPSTEAIEEAEGGMAKVATRAQTLLPLLRNFIQVTLLVMVTFVVLSASGINIGPLLAGAGVAGIAIGFGAQSLVRDIFAGIFFLVDDAFRLGEYIESDQVRGEVEKISIRSLQLRHHRGAVHTVPFGELKLITNHSRDWVIMKLEFGVRYDTDINLVKKVIKKIGADLMADPVHGKNLIEAPKSQGILQFGDSSLTIRVKFKSRPREQWVLRRVLNERLLREFAAANIGFAYPAVTVHVPEGAKRDDATTSSVAMAAAARVISQAPPS